MAPRARPHRRLSARSLPPGPRSPAALQTALLWARPFAYLRALAARYGGSFTLRVPGHPPLVFASDPDLIAAIHAADEHDLRPGEGAAAVRAIVGERSFMLAHGADHAIVREALLSALGPTQVRRHAAMTAAVRSEPPRAGRPTGRSRCIARCARSRSSVTLRLLLGRHDGPARRRGDRAARRRALDARGHEHSAADRALPAPRRPWAPRLAALPRRSRARRWHALGADRGARGRGPARGAARHACGRCAQATARPHSRQQVRDNVMSVILAGHETTAPELAWALQLLAHNPSVQAADRRDRCDAGRGVPDGDRPGGASPSSRVPLRDPPRSRQADRDRRPDVRPASAAARLHLPAASRPRALPDPDRFPPERFLDAPPPARLCCRGEGAAGAAPACIWRCWRSRPCCARSCRVATVLPAARRIERPRWRSVIVTPHRGGRVVLRARPQRRLEG